MSLEIILEIEGIEVVVNGNYIKGEEATEFSHGSSNEFVITFVSEFDDYYIYENYYEYLMEVVEKKVKQLRDEKIVEERILNLQESFRGYYGAY